VLPSREGADVFLVERGDIDAEGHLRGELPRGGEKSWNAGTGVEGSGRGESARHYEREAKNEREVENHVQKNLRAAAAQVTTLFDQHPGAKVVLFGTNGNLAAFEGELPERVASQVITRLPRPREWQTNGGALRAGLVAAVAEAVARCEHGDEEEVVEAVVGEALRGGVAVMGPEDVVDALNQGRVHRLVLETDFARTGWHCDRCGALGARDGHPTCPYCGADTHAVHALGEALVARALAEGGQVEVVAHSKKLHGYRGVAAFLRQSAPTGLKGASPPWPTAPGANRP
jgi:peptide subunit release factor 1 (eRF1)